MDDMLETKSSPTPFDIILDDSKGFYLECDSIVEVDPHSSNLYNSQHVIDDGNEQFLIFTSQPIAYLRRGKSTTGG